MNSTHGNERLLCPGQAFEAYNTRLASLNTWIHKVGCIADEVTQNKVTLEKRDPRTKKRSWR